MLGGSQLGKTVSLAVWLAFRIARDPANALLLMPSESQARSYSQSRLKPLLDSAPSVRDKYPRDRHNLKALEYRFSDFTLTLAGSNSSGKCQVDHAKSWLPTRLTFSASTAPRRRLCFRRWRE